MSIKRTIFIIIMTLILCIMTLGYAALQERIDIEVEANIDSTYRVEITRVQEGTVVVGDARSVQAPSYHDLTATFNVGLTNDTDYITYTIEITNYSTVDIRLNNTEITTTNNNISFVKSGIRNGDIILAGSTKTVTIKIKLDTETGSEQTGTITVMFDFTRLKGGLGEVQEDSYYSILPVDYQECEYIESTGTQYIDTGISDGTDKTNEYELDLILTNYNGKQYTGINGSMQLRPDGIQARYIYNVKYDGTTGIQEVYRNNELYKTDTWRIGTWLGTIYIGCMYNYTGPGISGKIYHARVFENDMLVRNYIPSLDNNGVPCMYDTVSGETFYNQGTGDFLSQFKD